MKTSPRNIRITTEGLQALKILHQTCPEQSTSAIISQALVETANKVATATVLRLTLIDPTESLTIQSLISEIIGQHQRVKKDILKIRPSDKETAAKIASVANNAQAEIDSLTQLRTQVAKMAQATAQLTPQDVIMLIEQVAPSCRTSISDSKDPNDYLTRRNKAIVNLIEAVITDDND